MRILFAGGGTGGHLYPAVALADALGTRAGVRFIGTQGRLETTIVPQAGYELRTIAAEPLQRSASLAAIRTAAINALGVAQALRELRAFAPDLVVATGGYVCFPVMVAARLLRSCGLLRARFALLEPNAQPGLTNRLLAPLVDEVWGAYDAAGAHFGKKYRRTGIPVRASLLRGRNRIEAARRLGLDPSRKTILAIGGSQGARTINETIAALVTRRALPPDWQVLHVCGPRDFGYMQAEEREPFENNLVALHAYLPDMADAYEAADLAIARSGASTLAEFAALGIPSILIPYPYASDDHQFRNAKVFETARAAALLEDRSLDADSLWWTMRELMHPERLAAMREAARSLGRRDACAAILARIDALAARKGAA
ncbi:MAG: undecaprenyldiphospho-muramoylpentapeptide beta-N-acetylglucosaminyltransferase [Candidatus Baltobacteraceae bacterium]